MRLPPMHVLVRIALALLVVLAVLRVLVFATG